jgi:hypothetical protein
MLRGLARLLEDHVARREMLDLDARGDPAERRRVERVERRMRPRNVATSTRRAYGAR